MLTNQLGAGAADLAELGQFGPDLPRSLSADAESMRFRLFDAVTTLVSEEARSKPIVLVLEDVHARAGAAGGAVRARRRRRHPDPQHADRNDRSATDAPASRYPRMAPALVGFLHGVWHLPLMLLTTAYNPAGNRLIVVPLFLAILTVAGILYGYLRNASGSLWPVVIAHGTFNAVLGALAGAAVVGNPATAAYLTGETGVFTLLALIIVAWVLVRRPAARKEDQLARDAHSQPG
jgi:hypothetical protein